MRKHSAPEGENNILANAMRFCSYQERCMHEVREKLLSWQVNAADAETIILKLIAENFISDERFAITFAGGKFRINKWGKIKIRFALSQKKISDKHISTALNEISLKDYNKIILQLIAKQQKTISEKNPLTRNHKIARYLMSKGFEPELIWQALQHEV